MEDQTTLDLSIMIFGLWWVGSTGPSEPRIFGDEDGETIISANVETQIDGGGGADYLMGGAGNDVIDGGGGSDYALFTGNAADYTLTRAGNNVTVVGADGTDQLIDVEYFRFDDGDVTIWDL